MTKPKEELKKENKTLTSITEELTDNDLNMVAGGTDDGKNKYNVEDELHRYVDDGHSKYDEYIRIIPKTASGGYCSYLIAQWKQYIPSGIVRLGYTTIEENKIDNLYEPCTILTSISSCQ